MAAEGTKATEALTSKRIGPQGEGGSRSCAASATAAEIYQLGSVQLTLFAPTLPISKNPLTMLTFLTFPKYALDDTRIVLFFMSTDSSQQFLGDLDRKVWTARRLAGPRAAVYKHAILLEPYQARVYDPAMGSGGFFVRSEKFIEEHGGRLGNLSVYGQKSNPTTWRFVAMNMAICGIDFNFSKDPANSYARGQDPIWAPIT